jgi:hypothetical protein
MMQREAEQLKEKQTSMKNVAEQSKTLKNK